MMLPCDHCPQSNQYKTGIPSCALPYCPISLQRMYRANTLIRALEHKADRNAEEEAELKQLKAGHKADLMLTGRKS